MIYTQRTFWRASYTILIAIIVSTGISGNVLASKNAEQEKVFAKAKAFHRHGNAQAAYDLLTSHEVEWSGGDAYDYLLGVIALDSGNIGEAIFSLQRLVVRQPEFSGARLELARAYFAAGENELARIEFLQLQRENPPDRVREAVETYLGAIDANSRTYTAASQYFLDLGLGYDSNAPASTDDNRFLGFVLSEKNREQNSTFGQVTLGGLWSRPLSPETQLLANGSVQHRINPSAHFVDPSAATVGLGLGWRRGPHTANVGITANASYLDRESNKQDYALNGSYLHKLSDGVRLNSFLRYGTMRFDDVLAVQDVNQLMFGFGIEQVSQNAMLNVTLLVSDDEERVSGSNFGNDGYTLQVSNTWFASGGRRYFASLSAGSQDYDEPFFGLNRKDDLYSINLGHAWARFPSRDWSLTVQVNYSKKQSTVDLYEFDRWEAGLFLRKVFN